MIFCAYTHGYCPDKSGCLGVCALVCIAADACISIALLTIGYLGHQSVGIINMHPYIAYSFLGGSVILPIIDMLFLRRVCTSGNLLI